MKRKCLPILKYGNLSDKLFIKTQLKKGVETELEHTNSKKIAKQIAKAHLVEEPKYYTYLSEMESKFPKHKR